MGNITNTKAALAEIFECGYDDLRLIDDAGVNVREYVEERGKAALSLKDFVSYVVTKANETLRTVWEAEKEEIMARIAEWRAELTKECGDAYFSENPDDSEVRIINFYEEKAEEIISKGFLLDFNFLDTHISIPYMEELDHFFLLDFAAQVIGFTDISRISEGAI